MRANGVIGWMLLFMAVTLLADEAAETAKKFWRAYGDGRWREAAALTVRGEIAKRPPLDLNLTEIKIVKTERKDHLADVWTFLRFSPLQGKATEECNATVVTALLRIDGRWRVDEAVTLNRFEKEVQESLLTCGVRAVKRLFDAQMDALDRWLKEFGQKAVPELERSLKEIEKEMYEMMLELKKEAQGDKKRDPLPPPSSGERI